MVETRLLNCHGAGAPFDSAQGKLYQPPLTLTFPILNPHDGLTYSSGFAQRLSDFPVVSKRIDHSSDPPTIGLIGDGPYYAGAGGDGPCEGSIRILYHHHHPHRTSAERFRTEVQVRRRLVSYPEFSCPRGQLSDNFSTLIVDAKQFPSSKCRLVKLNCLRPASNREHGGYRRFSIDGAL